MEGLILTLPPLQSRLLISYVSFQYFLMQKQAAYLFFPIFLYIRVQLSLGVQSCPTLHDPMDARFLCPSPTPRACSDSCPSSHWCHPAISSSVIPFSSCLQSFQHQGLFQGVSSWIRWPKYWSFGFSISPSSEYSGLISFRMYWLDLLAVQETLKSLLQHHSSKASFFNTQLSL